MGSPAAFAFAWLACFPAPGPRPPPSQQRKNKKKTDSTTTNPTNGKPANRNNVQPTTTKAGSNDRHYRQHRPQPTTTTTPPTPTDPTTPQPQDNIDKTMPRPPEGGLSGLQTRQHHQQPSPSRLPSRLGRPRVLPSGALRVAQRSSGRRFDSPELQRETGTETEARSSVELPPPRPDFQPSCDERQRVQPRGSVRC